MEIKSDPIAQVIALDSKLKVVFDEVGPLDLWLYKRTPYVALIGAIIGQKIKYVEAKNIRGNLFAKLGTTFTMQDVEKLTLVDMLKMGISSTNIHTIMNLHKYMKSCKSLILDKKLVKQVMGIGPWTLETAQLVCNPWSDIFPTRDVFLQNRVKKLYGMSQKPTIREMEIISEKWKPHRGLVTWHMWRWF